MTGLRSCDLYEILVTAVEQGGTQEQHPYKPNTFETSASQPGPAVNLHPIGINETAVTLSWDQNSLHKECIDSYRVCYQVSLHVMSVEGRTVDIG